MSTTASNPASRGRGADRLVEALTQAGVGRLFTLSGNQIMPVFDACLDRGIELTHVRHEAATVHMADAWGRLTGEPGIAMVTGGPGHANAISALYTARASESPMVLLSGHAPRSRLGQGAFQEMAQADMAAPVCKASWTVADADDFHADIAHAYALARGGRPGPVHLSLPFDLLDAPAEARGKRIDEPVLAESREVAARIAGAIAGAKRPLVLGGPHLLRLLDARARLELTEHLGAPVVASESPRGVNDPALGAFAEVLARADLIVALGRPVDFTLQFAQPPAVAAEARLVLVDPEPESLARSGRAIADMGRIDFQCVADTAAVVNALGADESRGQGDPGWVDEVADAIAYRPLAWQSLGGVDAAHAVEVARAVQRCVDAAEDPIVVIDGGEFGQWAQALIDAPTRLINGPAGAIGSAIPMALGARAARPGATVFALLGDGTFGFHMAEYDTAVRCGLDFVGVVGNDACWNAEYQIQLRNYGPDRTVGCELDPTRYDLVAAAMGAHGENVARAADLAAALARALDSRQAACVNVAIERQPAPVVRRGS